MTPSSPAGPTLPAPRLGAGPAGAGDGGDGDAAAAAEAEDATVKPLMVVIIVNG